MSEIPDSLGERAGFYLTYTPKCFTNVKPYQSTEIVRSDQKIKNNKQLEKLVVSLTKKCAYTPLKKQIKNIKKVYKGIKDILVDDSGAKIDLSTLVIAAARKDLINFADATEMIICDQVYQKQQSRKKYLILAPLANRIKHGADRKAAENKAKYEILQFVLTGDKRRERVLKVAGQIHNKTADMSRQIKILADGIKIPEEQEENYDPLQEFYRFLDAGDFDN